MFAQTTDRHTPRFDVVIETGLEVRARDGTSLVTELHRPARGDRLVTETLPVLLCRTPYGMARWRHEAQFLASQGYLVALQDWRQTQGAFDHDQWRPRFEATDGYDSVEWLAAQPWCDGRVGMWGHSAMGQAVQAVLPLRPPGLSSVFIIDAGLDYGSYPTRQNGGFGQAFQLRHSMVMAQALARDPTAKQTLRDAYLHPEKYFSVFGRPQAPVIRGRSVLGLSPEFEHRYLRTATTADLDDPFWKDGGEAEADRLQRWKDVPVCLVTGWYANHMTANITKYRWLAAHQSSQVELVIGHWDHHMDTTWAGAVDFGPEADIDIFRTIRLDWFDRTLRGSVPNGGGNGIRYFRMGGGSGRRNAAGRLVHGGTWQTATAWPPAGVEQVAYYFHSDGSLSPAPPVQATASRTWTFDPRDPVPTVGGNFCDYTRPDFPSRVKWMADGAAQDQRANSAKPFCRDDLPLATREDVLVFQTPPLDQDVTVTGELVARLWVSSSAVDTDFTVKLIDVHPSTPDFPEGFAMNLQDAVVRMRYRNGRIKPELIEPGRVYEVELAIHSTSNRFAVGHRIRVDVSSSNFPRIDVNANTGGPLGVPGPVRTAENTLHFDTARPSHVLLPILRRK